MLTSVDIYHLYDSNRVYHRQMIAFCNGPSEKHSLFGASLKHNKLLCFFWCSKMPRKYQLIRNININNANKKSNYKQSHKTTRTYVLFFLTLFFGFPGVLIISNYNIHANTTTSNGKGAVGKEAMLNNFVDKRREKKQSTTLASSKGKDMQINNAQQQNSSSSVIQINQLIDRSHRIEIPDPNRQIAFLHIGKSGGSSISLLLRNGCMTSVDDIPCEEDRWKRVPNQFEETIASKRIQFYLHTPHVESNKMAEYYSRVSSVVVVARDPMERFISAVISRHPKNIDAMRLRNQKIRRKAEKDGIEPPIWAKGVFGGGDREADMTHREAYKACYPNVDELAKCAAPNVTDEEENKIAHASIHWIQNGDHRKDIILHCRSICQGIMTGTNDYIQHLRLNYEAFLKDLPSDSEVFVIRTKNLWSDWQHINKMLGAKRYIEIPDKGSDAEKVNARGRLPVRNNLSLDGQVIVCQFLKNEIRIYIDLLNRAVNLSDDDIREALLDVQKNCPSVLKSLIEDKVT